MEETKSPHYVLVIDEKRNIILTLLHALICGEPHGRFLFEAACLQYGVTKEELTIFLKEWSDKEHALGWCRDPQCQLNQTKL